MYATVYTVGGHLVKATEVTSAWRKVMAAYYRVDDLVTCGLTACTPGSVTGLTLGNEYGKTLPFLNLLVVYQLGCIAEELSTVRK